MSVLSVSSSDKHTFSKAPQPYIYLLANQGVQGDIHCKPLTASLDNRRQVHLIEAELFQKLAKLDKSGRKWNVFAGDLGENITTFGIRLAELKCGSKIYFGDDEESAVVKVTGKRATGKGIEERFASILTRFAFVGTDKKENKTKVFKREVGIMGVVERAGYVQPGQMIYVEHPEDGKPLAYL